MNIPNTNAATQLLGSTPVLKSLTLGRYQLIAQLGEGGMGTVYKAVHLSLKRTVAVKVLRREYSDSPRFVQRFRREMEAVGRLSHQNVIRATDAGQEDGVLFIAMDYEEGATFNRVVAKHGPLRAADACALTCQAALGLEYIYQQDLVHRDIKPSNLLLTCDGVVKILDLGLARLRDIDEEGPTQSGAVLGTLDYIAPEQADNARNADIRADIYSLGCTIYKLLSGRAPFSGDSYSSAAQKLRAHMKVPIERPVHADLNDELWAIIGRMTAKDPHQRYDHPQLVADALLPFTRGAELVSLVKVAWASDSSSSMWTGTSSTLGATAESTPTLSRELSVAEMSAPVQRGLSRKTRIVAAVGALLAVAAAAAVFAAKPWQLMVGRGPSAEESPAASVPDDPLVLDAAPPLVWQNLFDRPPQVVQWFADEGHSRWHFDADSDQLEVRTGQRAMFHLGRVDDADYTLQVGIFKARWNGGSGIYFGYHDVSPATDENLWPDEYARYQFVRFGEARDEDNEMVFIVERGLSRVSHGPDGEPRVSSRSFASQTIERPLGEKILEVAVIGGKVRRVRLDGVDLPDLTADYIQDRVVRADHFGHFGTLNVVDDCVFSNARAMRHPQ